MEGNFKEHPTVVAEPNQEERIEREMRDNWQEIFEIIEDDIAKMESTVKERGDDPYFSGSATERKYFGARIAIRELKKGHAEEAVQYLASSVSAQKVSSEDLARRLELAAQLARAAKK